MEYMGRGYDGKFKNPKDKDKKNDGGFTFGVIMAILLVITRAWFPFVPLAAVGLYGGWNKRRNRKILEHCREYGILMGMREMISVAELSTTFGRTPDVVRRELKSKTAKEFFGNDAYLDVGRDLFCCPIPVRKKRDGAETRWADVAMEVLHTLRGDAVVQPQQPQPQPAPKPDPQPQPAPAAEPAQSADAQPKPEANAAASKSKIDYSEELERTLNELYDLNEKIQDVPVSDRIDRIGVLTGSIFRVVIEKPERESDVRKFMNYYLPTTLKLLKAYSLMEAQSYQGENIRESRKRIEETLDMLIQAFEKLLDKLFRDDALDIATDIDVLKTMVAGDGLSESGRMQL